MPSVLCDLRTRLVHALCLVGLAASLSACSELSAFNPFAGEKYEAKVLEDLPAQDVYNQGLARLEKKDSEGAAKKFSELDKNYPYSQWSKKGLMMATYAQYQAGNYDDAIASANRYVARFPTTPETPYAMYLAAMSYYSQIPDISRDQERSERALKLFTEIAEKYPSSEYAADSRYKAGVTRDQLAGKEMSVGRFYLTRKNYTAAINRFREVLAKYQSTRHTEEALYRLTEAYLGLGVVNEAQTAAAVLGHNYPESAWYKDAYALLASDGLQPNESQDSWITRTFKKIGLG